MVELPSKGFEALEEIKEGVDLFDEGYPWDEVFSKQFSEDIDAIEKELRVLQILKNKQVDIELFMDCDKWEEYVVRCENHADLSKLQYDLLKEILS